MTNHPSVERFRDYLRIPTLHPNPSYGAAITFLQAQSKEIGLFSEIHEIVPGKPILICTLPGEEKDLPSILLNSHIDVVPVFEECWTHPPFSAHKDEIGNIYARGSQDMKCVGSQYLEAIRNIISKKCKLKRTIHLLFVPDEEIGGKDGMCTFVKSPSFSKLNVGLALDEGIASEEEHFLIYNGERINTGVKFSISGSPGHGSLLLKNTCGEKLSKLLNHIMEFRSSQEKMLSSGSASTLGEVTTVNVTKIEGGVQRNVIPSNMNVIMDMRIAPAFGLENMNSLLNDWCNKSGPNITWEYLDKGPLGVTSLDCEWWKCIQRNLESQGKKFKVEIFPAATDSRFLREIGIPAFGFSPINFTPVRLHDHDEFLNEATFLKGITIYESLIWDLANH